jgi:hypothetical protein
MAAMKSEMELQSRRLFDHPADRARCIWGSVFGGSSRPVCNEIPVEAPAGSLGGAIAEHQMRITLSLPPRAIRSRPRPKVLS